MQATKSERRQVRYSSLEDLQGHAEEQAASQACTTGNWSCGQIFEHLARTMDKSIDGFHSHQPFIFRVLGKFVFKKRILRKGMPPGYQLPKNAAQELVPGPVETMAGLDHLRRAIARLQTENKRSPHPFFGKMSVSEWEQMHLRHAELHMSFLGAAENVVN